MTDLTMTRLAPISYGSPFPRSDDFNRDWWGTLWEHASDDASLLTFTDDGVEVGRALLEPDTSLDLYGVEGDFVEIVLIEVAASRRRRGYGARIVALLEAEYPDTQLAALSEDADEFWAGIGWHEQNHPEEDRRRLFLRRA